MNKKTAPEFRSFDDPRRHVPRLVYVADHPDHHHGVWQMSVRDHHNNLHGRCHDTWVEGLTSCLMWAHVNAAHGLTQNSATTGAWL